MPATLFTNVRIIGPDASVVLENVDHAGAHAQGAQVAALLGVRLVPRPDSCGT